MAYYRSVWELPPDKRDKTLDQVYPQDPVNAPTTPRALRDCIRRIEKRIRQLDQERDRTLLTTLAKLYRREQDGAR